MAERASEAPGTLLGDLDLTLRLSRSEEETRLASAQRRLLALGQAYLRAHPERPCRFDVVEVDLAGAVPRIRHLTAAFP